jgi:hypothetical protein
MRLVTENLNRFDKRRPLTYGVTAEGRSALLTSN